MSDKITTITFKYTANIFINAGILGLYKYVKEYKARYQDKYHSLSFNLKNNQLTISCDELIPLLEDVYYYMGIEMYDTATKKQKEEKLNVFYIEDKNKFEPFPKMNTYGLTELLTNNAQGTTRKAANTYKIATLKKENENLANKIQSYFETNNLKMLSKVYLNESYTKITRLEIDEDYLMEGKERCPLTNECFKKLVSPKNTSPFIKGLQSFNTFLTTESNKISLKALYAIRFSPVYCMYGYRNNYETIVCNFYNSNSLQSLYDIYKTIKTKPKAELEETNYLTNIKFHNFKIAKKSGEDSEIETNKDAIWDIEITIMLLYTFFKQKFEGELVNEEEDYDSLLEDFDDLFSYPISLVSLKADQFSGTLRPNYYQEFDKVKFVLGLFFKLEAKYKIPFEDVWKGLRLNTSKAQSLKSGKTYSKGLAVERQIRAAVFENVTKGKSILNQIEKLFFESYKILFDNKIFGGYRSYKKLLQFLKIYENSIDNMEKEQQEKVVKLGHSIGIKILNFENAKEDQSIKRANAKNGRKYIIRLHNARTLEQFTEAIIGIMQKFGLSNKAIETVSQDNFIMVRQYAVIGALNVINGFLSANKNNN